MQQLWWMEGSSALVFSLLLLVISLPPASASSSPMAQKAAANNSNWSKPAEEYRGSCEYVVEAEEQSEEDHCASKTTAGAARSVGPERLGGDDMGFLTNLFVHNQGPVDVWMVLVGMSFAGLRRLCQTKYAAIEPIVRVIF